MLKKYINRETIFYLIFGVLTTAVDFCVYQWMKLLHAHYLLSQTIAWIAAVLFAFLTNKFFVFQSKKMQSRILYREFFSFVSARIASFLFNIAGLWVLVEIWKMNEWIAKFFLAVCIVIINYFFSKLFIFKQKP